MTRFSLFLSNIISWNNLILKAGKFTNSPQADFPYQLKACYEIGQNLKCGNCNQYFNPLVGPLLLAEQEDCNLMFM